MAETEKPGAPTDVETPAQPGTVIVPTGAPREADQRTAILDKPPLAEQAAVPAPHTEVTESEVPSPEAPAPATPQALPEPPQDSAPQTTIASPPAPEPPSSSTPNSLSATDNGGVSWTAAEFIAHDKSPGWYVALILAGVLLAGLVFLLTHDPISTSVVLVGALVLAIYGARKPKQQMYRADSNGVSIGQRYHGYEEFRSFAVAPEGQLASVIFMPLKRFAPLTTIYFDPKYEDKIVDLFIDILPFEEHAFDVVDRFMQRIRF
ncbi:MAG TPA: hypothetical protein VK712_00650 [Verrucomicrobiae bacterium]|nr:hypothetical protein [Verrucomicrobiae bacterium]